MKKYPECFPANFEAEILPKGAKEENKSVYRVIKYGTINRESFISTYEEMQRKLIPPKKRLDLNNPGTYSTSCNIDYSEAQYALNIFMRHRPRAFIAKGETEGSCGPCQLTSEREERLDTHVDWWIYDEAEPQLYFEEVKKDE
ncbi:hypothetical protein NXH76_26740 [Blautia schinkii]|nr:hypothetical protein [Blautia schinkii]